MDWYNSTGEMIKWFIKKVRNKTIKETARTMGINYTTFSEQLINNTLSAETLFKLAAYLDIDLNWMMVVLLKINGLKKMNSIRTVEGNKASSWGSI